MAALRLILTALSCVALTAAAKNDVYLGYTVHGVEVKDNRDQETLFKLTVSLNLDVWEYGVVGVRDARVMVAPESKDQFLQELDDKGISHYLDIDDVTRMLNEYDEEVSKWKQTRGRLLPFEDYPRYDEFRLWRRTRSFNPAVSTTCYGVDANRNFNVSHNTIGVSSNPCSDVYPGQVPFSEPETGYVRDVLHQYVDRIQVFLDIHSHGNLVLYGYGDTSLPPNVVDLHHVGEVIGAAIDVHKLPQAPLYRVGNSALVLYGSSGSAQDYGQHVGVPFSYTLELPGYGYSFSVPPRFITQINEETWYGIAASARESVLYYRERYNNQQ